MFQYFVYFNFGVFKSVVENYQFYFCIIKELGDRVGEGNVYVNFGVVQFCVYLFG